MNEKYFREFDPGSGRTLAACLTHASRTGIYVNTERFADAREVAGVKGEGAEKAVCLVPVAFQRQ
ncbi:MAG: hypothetical protein BWY15_02057 [Firmicutes bacterium ADurb.Bin193]|nr:MAG: hypothetical protein BWY15_02057 [Firmicutes bacterium ADurb.Bin193]